MRIIKSFVKLSKNLFETLYYVITVVFYMGFLFFYVDCTKKLQKPSGIKQAFDFLLKNPEEYTIALFTGIGAGIITILFLLGTLVTIFTLLCMESEFELTETIVKIVVAIMLSIMGITLLKGIVAIIGVTIIGLGLIYFVLHSD